MGRDWSAAHEKVAREGSCRVCRLREYEADLDPAHVVPRAQARPGVGEDARNIVPLCRTCHASYDGQARERLDLLPYLSHEEQAYAVLVHPGGMMGALRRVTNRRWMVVDNSDL